jgi:hypothetical protein
VSHETLTLLRDAHAFDSVPLEQEMNRIHVPFDDLNGDGRTEKALADAVHAVERVALIGPSGCGKSSVAHYVLDGGVKGCAPIWVSVGFENDDTLREPKAFAQHLMDSMGRELRKIEAISEADRRDYQMRIGNEVQTPDVTVTESIGVGSRWLLPVDVGGDVASVVSGATYKRSANEVIEAVGDLADAVSAHRLTPVLVIDDSDRWVKRPGTADRTHLVGPFFGDVLRAMAEQRLGLVVAVHESYLAGGELPDAAASLETKVRLPALAGPEHLDAIVARRVANACPDASVRDVLDHEALAELFRYYRDGSGRSIRATITKLHEAHVEAANANSERIEVGFVASAVSG